VKEWRRLVELQVEEPRRGEYAGIALVFAELARCLGAWKTALEGWNVKTSEVVEEWKAEGRAEGQLQATRGKLLRALQVRFGPDLPGELVKAIEEESNASALDRWFDLALTAPSLDRFRAAFSTNGA
jgi:hypothetical protein